MRSCLVEVVHIRIEHALELLLMKNQQMIETLLPDAPQEPLTDRIGSGRVIACFEDRDAAGCGHARETRSKFAITIVNEIFRCLPIRRRFPELLRHPGIRGRPCNADMDHPSRFQFYDEEGKERSKEQIGHLQEVASPNAG